MNIHIVAPEASVADDGYEVWLNTEIQNFDGLCIGVGQTKAAAIADAAKELMCITRQLSELLWQARHAS